MTNSIWREKETLILLVGILIGLIIAVCVCLIYIGPT